MDTSKEYIEMCKKAVEVQEFWKPTKGDVYAYLNRYYCPSVVCVDFLHKDPYGHYSYEGKDDTIWLPRQDQLQGMLILVWKERYKTSYTPIKMPEYADNFWNRNILSAFEGWVNRHSPSIDKPIWRFSSMEQLWLAFIMKEKFNKVWSGEDWVNESRNTPRKPKLL